MAERDREYDVVVIGGGSGGYGAAKKASSQGMKVALVDDSKELGGLCILRGCMPSKTLIETANVMRAVRESSKFCVQSEAPRLDEGGLKGRLTQLITGFQESRERQIFNGEFDFIRGRAEFCSPHTIKVDGEDAGVIKANYFVIATGSQANVLKIEGLDTVDYWTSDEVTQLTTIPKSAAIIGAGAVGMEFAHLYEGFGTEVSVLARSRALSNVDEDLSEALHKESTDRGLRIYEQAEISKVEKVATGVKVFFEKDDSEQSIEVEKLIIATGRKPNIRSLNLEAAEIAFSKKGVEINEYCQTNQERIFAIGDCANSSDLVHIAVLQGEAVGSELTKPVSQKRSLDYLNTTEHNFGIFTEPEVVKVGLTKSEADERGLATVEYSLEFNDQGKGEIKQSKYGFAKMLFEKETGRILGGSAVGPNVVDHAHIVLMAIHAGMTAEEFLKVPFYHPTLAEVWSYIAEDFLLSS